MKSLILSLFLALSLVPMGNAQDEVYTNGVFYPFSIFPDTVKYVVQDAGVENKTNHLVLGKTYSFSTELVDINTEDSKVELFFSNDTFIRLYPNTEFSVNVFDQVVTNFSAQPSPLKASMDNLGVSLMDGILDIVSNSSTNSPITFQTPNATFAISTGVYRFDVDSMAERVVAYAIEGDIIIYDNVTLRETVIPQGNGIVVFPVRSEIGGTSKFVDDGKGGRMVSDVRKVRDGDLKELRDIVKPLENIKETVKFFVVDKKIVGIRLVD